MCVCGGGGTSFCLCFLSLCSLDWIGLVLVWCLTYYTFYRTVVYSYEILTIVITRTTIHPLYNTRPAKKKEERKKGRR